MRYLGNRWTDFDYFFANCSKFYSLFILKKERLLKIINFEKSSKIYIFTLKTQNWQQCKIRTRQPKTDFGFEFSDQKLVGIRQNRSRGHFRPKICRPGLYVDGGSRLMFHPVGGERFGALFEIYVSVRTD